ncbi:aspartate aminotransferase [Syntrophotalea acetylenivorans]|uniref:Aminotransferase n=1 Tax=Syntrophotalea acetylenivorans TaxID=1842532 RepID=A0A1L3GP54_9BACT|nr:pyridoxal phosphate-dependent aminotransferase [Syntrophotalea acetylenivorans]APG27717.1 aspartate aminotransferase [Syntrophotalea acetylenivorans]
MSIHRSHRADSVTPFLAMEVMERAQALEAAGRDIIYLCLGEPDLPTPAPVVNRAIAAIEQGQTRYTHSLGDRAIRQAIADHYRNRYRVTVDPDCVLVSAGTSPLMLLLFSMLLDPGDEVILSDPSYACYPDFIRFAGGVPRQLRTLETAGFQPHPAKVRPLVNDRTRAVLINSPSNPTGSLLPTAWLKELAQLPVPLVSDEIYHGLTYEGEEHSALEFSDQAFVLGGFSKAYAMTGWRLGYLIAPAEAMRTLQTLHQNFMICASSFVQQAGISALEDCQTDLCRMRATYNERRLFLLQGLQDLGLKIKSQPAGAFYILADSRHISADSLKLAMEILEQTGVALTPGIDFGAGAEGFLRFSYANSRENIDTALQRLAPFFKAWA